MVEKGNVTGESVPLKTKEDIAQDNGVVVEKPMEVPESIPLKEEKQKNAYTEQYNNALENSELRETALQEISDQWHDPRSRKLIEESIAPEIIEEAKQKYPQEETTLTIKDEATKETEIPDTKTGTGDTKAEPNKDAPKAGEGEPPKPPKEEPVAEGGDKNSEKGILNRLFKSKNLPKEAKDGLEKEGLKYKVSSQEEAKSIALSTIDELGISEAFALGEAGRFKGGVNGAIMAESINRLAEMEAKATTPQEKVNLALQSAELITRFDEISRTKGQDISYINYFYKKSPLGVEMAENARKKKEFDNWAKPKEQSWKDAFEGFMKDPEFQEIMKGEIAAGMKAERVKVRAEKKEKVHKAIDSVMDKWAKKLTPKSTGGASAKGVSAESVFKSVGAAMKKAYDIGEPIAEIIKNAIETISEKLGHKDWGIEEFKKENWEKNLGKDEGYKEGDTRHQKRIEYLEGELKRIRERRRKEPKDKKESTREIPEDEKALLDEIEAEQTKWDSEKDAARQVANDYQKLETERNRQLKRVGEINEKIDILRQGELPEPKTRTPKADTPEIEALKAEKDALEKSVRESIAHEKKMQGLEAELKRLEERNPKDTKPDSTKEITPEEKELREKINAEREAWKKENSRDKRVENLEKELDRLKSRRDKDTNPKNKPHYDAEEQRLRDEVKSEREAWAHEKKMDELETELQRLKDRKAKEPKPDSKRVISAEERLKRDEIEAEKKAWDIENNISKLETELQRVKDRQKKTTNPQQRRELTTAEKDLVKQIKIEKEAWRKEVEPERKVREALKAAEKSLAEYERRIAEKDISKEPTSTTPETPELKALREKRDAKRKEYQAMKKEMTKTSDADVQAERNRKYLEAFSKKLKGLSTREKEEVVLRAHKKLIERGALDYTEFRDIISEVTGRGKMTDAEAAKLKELVAETNKVDVAAERARTERTQEARVLHALAQVKASKASKELGNILYNKPNIGKRLTSLLQLNTLGIASLIRNPAYNIVNQLVVRFPVGIGKTLIDRTIQAGGKAFGKDIQPETDILSLQVQKEFFKKLGLGSKEAVNQFVTGLNRMDYIDKELQGQQIRPLKSMEDLWDFAKGKKHLSKSQVIDKLIQASPQGWTAEIIARALNFGDKPQRFAAEGAQSAAFAKALGLKDIDYDLFIDFPREEAYMQLRKRGVPDAEAAKQADYIRDTIKKEGARSTFQQDNMLNDMLNGIPLSQTGVGGLVKATVVSPYIKIPANAYWSYYNIINPEVAILQSAIYAGKAYAKRNGTVNFAFDKKESTWRHDLNESKYWLAHAATGYGVRAAVAVLVAAGIYRPSNTQDDSKKEREGEQNYEQQGSVNVTKLWAFMKGEDPSKIKEGYTISNNWFGILGTVGDTMAQQEESLAEEQKQNREDYWTEAFDRMAASGLPQFEQGVFGNASSFLNAVNRGGSVAQSWGVNTLGMFTNIVHPAAFAQVSKNQLPYYTKTKADTFKEELKNAMLTRSSWLRKLSGQYPPSKVSIWGEKIEREGSTIQKLFGISKSNDDNFAEPIYKDYKKTNDVDFFPPSVKPEVTVDGERVKLPVKQAYELEELIGRNRKDLIAPFINGMAEYDGYKYTDLKSEESKIAALRIIYNMGRERGMDEFKQKYPEYQNKREEEDKEARKERERLNKEFKESLESEVPAKD